MTASTSGACLGVILAVASLSGCAHAALSELPPGVSVSIKQYRLDYAPRALEVSVTNDGDTDITVARASFGSRYFDGTSSWTRSTDVPAGTTRDLRVLLGSPVCGTAAGEKPTVTLTFTTTDGATGRVTTEPADQFATVAKVTSQDCITQRTLAVASLATGDALRVEERDGHPVALLDLSATPTGAPGAFSVASVARSTLIKPADSTAVWSLDWSVSAGTGPLSTTLEILPSNCNPHIVAEDKRGTYFPLAVTLDDGTTGTVYVGVSNTVREQLYSYVGQYCGW